MYIHIYIYTIKMTTVNNNTYIIVSENHNTIIVPKLKVLCDSGQTYVFSKARLQVKGFQDLSNLSTTVIIIIQTTKN